jgi:hypothetical protein
MTPKNSEVDRPDNLKALIWLGSGQSLASVPQKPTQPEAAVPAF